VKDIINIPEKKLSKEEYRSWIVGLEGQLNKHDESMDRHTCLNHGYKLEQAITPGIYTRELTMPAGSLVISRIHLQEHPFMITKGKVSVYDGENIITHNAPYKGVTKKGTKRVLYNHEDTTWITFHPITNETIEDCDKDGVITCGTYEDFDKILLESDSGEGEEE
jgi:hypothetical protein